LPRKVGYIFDRHETVFFGLVNSKHYLVASVTNSFFGSPPSRSRAILLARIVGGIELFKAERADRRYLRDVLPGFRPMEM
jgi:hypothetical protein